MKARLERRWRAPEQPATRAFFHVTPDGLLQLHARCACGATCHGYPSLVLFVQCRRCGAEVPIQWDHGRA